MKRYSRKYIKEAINYWTRRLNEAEGGDDVDLDKPSNYDEVLGLGPDEQACLFMCSLIVYNKKTGKGRVLNDQEIARLREYTQKYLKKQAERQGLKKKES